MDGSHSEDMSSRNGARHRFDPRHAEALESGKRFSVEPIEILRRVGVRAGMKVVDVGCGTGFFSIPAAILVNREGRVFAVDVQEEMLASLRGKIDNSRGFNIEVILSDGDSIPLPDDSMDLAFMVDVLHELNTYSLLEDVYRVLKPRGKLGVVDWKKIRTECGPPLRERLTPKKARSIIEKSGFTVQEIIDVDYGHYALLATKA